MNRLKECQAYIKRWYAGDIVRTIEMDGGDSIGEQIIQSLVVELLREFIDNPIPESLSEGTLEFNTWIDISLHKAMRGIDFSISVLQEDAIKNLAFNYWVYGIECVQSNPTLENRLIFCSRYWPANQPA